MSANGQYTPSSVIMMVWARPCLLPHQRKQTMGEFGVLDFLVGFPNVGS